MALPLLSFTATLMMTRLVLVLNVGDGWSCASNPAQARAAETIRSALLFFIGNSLKTEPDIYVGGSHRPRCGGQAVECRTDHRSDIGDIPVIQGVGCLQAQFQAFAAAFST